MTIVLFSLVLLLACVYVYPAFLQMGSIILGSVCNRRQVFVTSATDLTNL